MLGFKHSSLRGGLRRSNPDLETKGANQCCTYMKAGGRRIAHYP
jgi:hypothetical protein